MRENVYENKRFMALMFIKPVCSHCVYTLYFFHHTQTQYINVNPFTQPNLYTNFCVKLRVRASVCAGSGVLAKLFADFNQTWYIHSGWGSEDFP